MSDDQSRGNAHDAAPATAPQGGEANVLSWELARLRQSLPMVVRRAMSFSALPCFDADLIAAVRDYYGLEMDVAAAEAEILEDDDERIRFFPWFLWDWKPADGRPNLGQRFLEEETNAPHERRLIEALNSSYVGFYEAEADATAAGVRLRNIATNEVVHLFDEGLEGELYGGQIVQCRLVRVGSADTEYVLIDAVYAVLPSEAREGLEAEIATLPQEVGGVSGAFERYTAEFLEVAEQLLENLATPPEPRNSDGGPMVLCQSLLIGDDASQIEGCLESGLGHFEPLTDGLWRWNQDGQPAGFVQRRQGGAIALGAPSTRHLAALEKVVTDASGAQVPALKSLTDFVIAAEGWAEHGGGDPWFLALPEVRDATRAWADRWTRAAATTGSQGAPWLPGVARVIDYLDRIGRD
ncbi:MAG: hypothetical protein ACPGU1_08420 [Myxococcota bacterium]